MESRKKEDLHFDSLCNGCISIGYAGITEYRLCIADAFLVSKFYKEAAVSYIKAEKILPEELIRQIQEYADGVYIYIPRKPGTRRPWGQETDYKAELKARNDRIRHDFASGEGIVLLSRKYHLSEKSIRRILQES